MFDSKIIIGAMSKHVPVPAVSALFRTLAPRASCYIRNFGTVATETTSGKQCVYTCTTVIAHLNKTEPGLE